MPGELAEDEQLASANTDFKVNVHGVIVDTVTDSSLSIEGFLLMQNFAQISPVQNLEILQSPVHCSGVY